MCFCVFYLLTPIDLHPSRSLPHSRTFFLHLFLSFWIFLVSFAFFSFYFLLFLFFSFNFPFFLFLLSPSLSLSLSPCLYASKKIHIPALPAPRSTSMGCIMLKIKKPHGRFLLILFLVWINFDLFQILITFHDIIGFVNEFFLRRF